MKKLLMVLINVIGVACFCLGLLKLAMIGSAYDWHLWLWWTVYMIVPLTIIGVDIKYFDKVFGKDLYLKK